MSELQCDDPVFRNTRREAILILAIWAVALCWVVPYCILSGYQPPQSPEELQLVWGMPEWIFYGVALPWMIASAVTIGLCLFVIQDDDLGVAPEEQEFPEESPQS